tara:strand:+ start:2176 stop:2949 length:774 start_codon:yes stop_codon:yes gene_type:complete
MKIFIDSADIDEIKDAYSMGIVDGVTTNPSLIKKAVAKYKTKDMKTYIKQILLIAKGTPVSLEVTELNYEGMIKQGLKLYKMFNSKDVYIKIPVNTNNSYDGIRAIKYLSKKGIKINCTLIFTPEQAVLAAKAGAKFVSPFAGRIDDFIRKNNRLKIDKTAYFPAEGLKKYEDNGIVSGVDLVAQTKEIFETYNIKCEVLAASLRNARQVRECMLNGADIATLPYTVIKELLEHTKTDEGIVAFTKDIIPEYAKLLK